jgi:uncharacterized membrane protein
MKNINNLNYNKQARSNDMIFGWLAIIGALLAPGAFLIATVLEFFTTFFSGGALNVFLSGVPFTIIWGAFAIKTLIRASRVQTYLDVFGAYPRLKIEHIANTLKRPLRNVSADLNVFKKRRYFRDMEFDLDSKEVVFVPGSPALPEVGDEAKTVYQSRTGLPVWPFLITLVTVLPFVAAATGFWTIVFGFLAAVGAGILAWTFSPPAVYFEEVRRTAPKVRKPTATGIGDLDGMLGSIYENKKELVRLCDTIQSPKIRTPLKDILRVLDQITEYVTANPDKVKVLRQFVNYYLPTTVNFLQTYEELEGKTDKGANILETLGKIEGVTANMTAVFKQEYDALFADRVMDVSAEVAVMQTIIGENSM